MRGSRTASSDMSAWCSAVVLLSLILLLSVRENNASNSMRGSQFSEKPCEEIYVVGEGETLHTIGDKCGDPFIVERNPHIHDPDDVFPGLVLRIAPFYFSRKISLIVIVSNYQEECDFRLNRSCVQTPFIFSKLHNVDQFVKNVCLAISNEGSKSFTPAKVVSKRSRLMFWKYVRRPFFCDPTTDDDSRSSSPETDRADVLKV
ncbi:unnamed protein product [Brassica rapa]|uniref:BnaA02g33200D protein n=2 Tax=Brassica TaxID=3705 RepID=A0A078H1M0_BRANA|nr:unnamed protein product [Brassica rapa]CDY30698.1 BnaA02g33200D [Brassica napus]VDC93053.1 unnamed protein product [Brassica rapa]